MRPYGSTAILFSFSARHPSNNFSSGVGLTATPRLISALPGTEWLEFDPTVTAIYEGLFVEPLAVEAGNVRVPTTPGLGAIRPCQRC
jgi:hypothetical protein